MALFSFRHSVKTFSEKREDPARSASAGQTAAHISYITRRSAARMVIRGRVETSDRLVAQQAETSAMKRKGRVAERFIIALPIEATPKQREALALAFAEKITMGTAKYIVAIHDQKGNDRSNPHMHLVAFDHFQKTVGRGRPRSVIGMARKGAVEQTAAMWAETHNEMMRGWGYGETATISHLSNKARGIERIPTIHEGATARKIERDGICYRSKPDWKKVDGGHSRSEANRVIREINTLKGKILHEGTTGRLGSSDDESKRTSGPISPYQRARESSDFRDNRHTAEPHQKPIGDCETSRKPEQTSPFPTRGKRCRDRKSGDSSSKPWEFPHTPPMAPDPPVIVSRHRRGVRRIWLELVVLREKLRIKLTQSNLSNSTPPREMIEDKKALVMFDRAARPGSRVASQIRGQSYLHLGD